MKAKVFVTLKKSVLDPQGKTIQSALDTMGFGEVDSVRCGKMIELSFKPSTKPESVEQKVRTMCEKLLANTVIEEYRYEIQDGK